MGGGVGAKQATTPFWSFALSATLVVTYVISNSTWLPYVVYNTFSDNGVYGKPKPNELLATDGQLWWHGKPMPTEFFWSRGNPNYKLFNPNIDGPK